MNFDKYIKSEMKSLLQKSLTNLNDEKYLKIMYKKKMGETLKNSGFVAREQKADKVL